MLVKMPCNLAVLDMNAADGIAEQYPDIDAWYIGGDSPRGAQHDIRDFGGGPHDLLLASNRWYAIALLRPVTPEARMASAVYDDLDCPGREAPPVPLVLFPRCGEMLSEKAILPH